MISQMWFNRIQSFLKPLIFECLIFKSLHKKKTLVDHSENLPHNTS